jgi:hypothetical protein
MNTETQDKRNFSRFMPPFDRPRFKRRALRTYHRTTPTLFWIAVLAFLAMILVYGLYAPRTGADPQRSSEANQVANPTPSEANPATLKPTGLPDPCGLKDVVCSGEKPAGKRVIRAKVTTYQAVAAQTDSTPCSGAMAGVDFCHPLFPIVANNCLAFGTKVEIRGQHYTVADRMNSRYGCAVFDVLTDGENFTLTNEPVSVL